MRLPNWAQKETTWQRVGGYTPNAAQETFHRSASRRVLVAGGERAGKSFSVAKEVLARVPFAQLIWILGPDYEQARAEFQYLVDDLATLGALGNSRSVSQPRVGPWWLRTKSGQVIETRSAQHEERIASKAPDGIVMAEAAQQSYMAYLKTYGRLSQNKGWLIAVGTFEGSLGWYPDLFQRWQGANDEAGVSFSLPTWSNLARYPGGRDDAEIRTLEAIYPAELFQERFGAIPCKPAGLVFREFDFVTHVRDLGIIYPNLPVELAIDPGYAGAYAVLAIQHAGPFVHVIDEVYERGMVAQDVIARCKARPWWPQVRKRSSGQTGGVIDIAGTQHQGLNSHVEVWASEGDVGLRWQPVSVEQGIQSLRVLLRDPGTQEPRIFFSAKMRSDKDGSGLARGTLAEMGLYRYKQAMDGQPVSELPIDANNHGLKALGYWAFDRFGPVGGRTPPPPQKKRKGFGTAL